MSFGGGRSSTDRSSERTSVDLAASVSRLNEMTEKLRSSRGDELGDDDAQEGVYSSKLERFQSQVDDLDKTVDDLCGSFGVEKELKAAKALRDEKAAIRRKAMEEEEAAEKKYNEAVANARAAPSDDRGSSVRQKRLEADRLDALKVELEARRKAREAAELVYSSDLAGTLRRLRELEIDLEQARSGVTSAYERRRLHDSLRRIRLSRLSLGEQMLDYDFRGRRLASLYESPSLYTGLASRAYDVYPYYRSTRAYWPYSSAAYAGYYPYADWTGYSAYSPYYGRAYYGSSLYGI